MFEPGATKPIPVFPVDPVTGVPSAGPGAGSTGAVTKWADSGAPHIVSAVVLAANPLAKLRIFTNDSDQMLYVRYEAAAASVAGGGYTVKIPPGSSVDTDYAGEVRAIMGATIVTGWVNVTECT